MSRGHDDYQSEPVRGLPERLPAGERILWQGSPRWWHLAKTVFHIRAAAIYFAGLLAWRADVRMTAAGDVHAAFAAVVSLLPVVAIGLGLLSLLAWLSCRTTVYTITNRRVVLRIGIALTTSINIPFSALGAAGFRPRAGATGDIALTVLSTDRLAYSNLWPHVRPWRWAAPEPMLRSIPNARHVAGILSAALREALPGTAALPPVMATGKNGHAGKDARQPSPIGMPVPLNVPS
jgi:hypothetical protein